MNRVDYAAKRAAARRLREREGMPLKQIAARLGVSASSVHSWTRDIELTPEQRRRNRTGPRGPQNPALIARRAAARSGAARERRRRYQDEGRARARLGDPIHLAGCMLHWAEGSKKRNAIKFSNSDPRMVRIYVDFLRACLGAGEKDIAISLHVYLGNGLSLNEIERYWLNFLHLSARCLRGHSINPFPTSSSGRKRNKLPYGVCSVVVHDTRRVQHIYGAIQEYGGFDEPAWLD